MRVVCVSEPPFFWSKLSSLRWIVPYMKPVIPYLKQMGENAFKWLHFVHCGDRFLFLGIIKMLFMNRARKSEVLSKFCNKISADEQYNDKGQYS